MAQDNYPRHLTRLLNVAVKDTPVVLINGPRQSGKTTLVKQYAPDYSYYTLDDESILSAVKEDPIGFVGRIDKGVIDEVQRAPELLRAIKLSIDQNRQPGRFLLTGSANLLALPQIGDSLAGRMEILTLYPLSFAEITKRESQFLSFATAQNWALNISDNKFSLVSQVLTGGYPEMLARNDATRRNAWAKSYLKAIIERDIKDISSIEKILEMPQLLEILAKQSGQLTNYSKIAGQIHLDSKTAQTYISLLETLFLVNKLRPWHKNTINRIVKSPKTHFIDSGLLAAISKLSQKKIEADNNYIGPLLETWVYGELLKMINLSQGDWDIFHYRDKDKVEVDFVLENSENQVIGIEVKASRTVTKKDFGGLKKLASIAKNDWLSGIVLYSGDKCLSFGDNLWAIPFSLLH